MSTPWNINEPFKRKEFLTHINLENIMLIERNQAQKTAYYMTPLI